MTSMLRHGILLLTALATFQGCNPPQEKKAQQPVDENQLAPLPPAKVPIEIFTWWTAPGEVEAFQAFITLFHTKYPEMSIVDLSRVSGNGQSAHAALRKRIREKRPPDCFQVYPQLLFEFLEPGNEQIESLDSLYKLKYWGTLFPKTVVEAVRLNGHYYAVPIGIHRRNTLFCSPSLVSAPPKSLDDFFKLARTLQKRGIPALALGTGGGDWTLRMVFNAVLAGSAGIQFFNDFYSGRLRLESQMHRKTLVRAVKDYARMLAFTNEDAPALSWEEAAALLIDGKAAMYLHGDWAGGYYGTRGFTPVVTPAPGTDGLFAFSVDAFALSKNAPHPENARRFLNAIGSTDGQVAFNKLKGSLPVHKEASVKGWGAAAEATQRDFQTATIQLNMNKYLFNGLEETLGAHFRHEITAKALVAWIVDNYHTALTRLDIDNSDPPG